MLVAKRAITSARIQCGGVKRCREHSRETAAMTSAAQGRHVVVLLCSDAVRTGRRISVSGWNNPRVFDHQDHRAIWRARAMHDALRYDEAFAWLQIDRTIFEVDDEMPVEHEEKLVVVVVLV